MSQINVYKWYKLFNKGREDVNEDAHPGRPSTSTVDKNVEKVKMKMTENVSISFGSCHAIVLLNY